MAKGGRGGKIGTAGSTGSNAESGNTAKAPILTEAEAAKYKKASQSADYIREQVGLDISKYHNDAARQFEKRGQYTIDITDMGQEERTKLATALNQKYSPYNGSLSGTWIFTITKKK